LPDPAAIEREDIDQEEPVVEREHSHSHGRRRRRHKRSAWRRFKKKLSKRINRSTFRALIVLALGLIVLWVVLRMVLPNVTMPGDWPPPDQQ